MITGYDCQPFKMQCRTPAIQSQFQVPSTTASSSRQSTINPFTKRRIGSRLPTMSEISNNSRGANELLEFCGSESLSDEGLRQIFERHKYPHDVNNYDFFLEACINERVNEGIIECLLEYFPAAASSNNYFGQTPLHYACSNENMTPNIIQLLIDAAPATVRSADANGDTPLHSLCACRNPLKIVQFLIDTAPDSVSKENNVGRMPLHELCVNKEIDERAAFAILKLLIDKHPDSIRHADNDGGLPIHCAAGGGASLEFCQALIEESPGSERIAEVGGELPLHYACGDNTLATVEYLYKLYPDAINHADTDGYYPIHFTITGLCKRSEPENAIDIVKFLLECDPNVKLQLTNGLSLLDFACCLEYHDSSIETALEMIKAIYDAYPEAIEDDELESNMIPVQAFINSQLVYARRAKGHRLMTTPDEKGQLPLHRALQNDVRLGSIKLLVNGNPSAVRNIDDSGVLPLHVACQHHDSASVVQYLIGLAMGTLRAVDYGNNTALHYACRGAKYDTIALLLDNYDAVSVSKRNTHGKLPIDLLLESNTVENRESIEYTESVFRLLKAYPETIMGIDIQTQSASASCSSQSVKKRKLGHE